MGTYTEQGVRQDKRQALATLSQEEQTRKMQQKVVAGLRIHTINDVSSIYRKSGFGEEFVRIIDTNANNLKNDIFKLSQKIRREFEKAV